MPTTFAELGVPDPVVRALRSGGVESPFDIQTETIPHLLDGHDLCGRAPTGSGKTLAFGIPLAALAKRADAKRPTALVLAPTRELAEQISEEIRPLAAARQRNVLPVYGGVAIKPQIAALAKGADILVACPGRLHDLLQQQALTLDRVRIVVIDEADRMADMGFLPEVRRLLDLTVARRQTVLFSATLDRDVAVLTRDYQRSPIRVEIGDAEPDITAMEHHFWSVERPERIAYAVQLIREHGPTIVFSRSRHGADRIAKQLNRGGVEAVALHGGRSQNQRDRALASFTSGRALALVATDVAARGIHVDDVACVLHIDPPDDHKAYLHRSGRTARAGSEGVVVTFVNQAQRKAVKQLQREVGLQVPVVEPTIPPADLESAEPVERPDAIAPPRPKHRDAQKRQGPKGQGQNGQRRRRNGQGPGSRSRQNGQQGQNGQQERQGTGERRNAGSAQGRTSGSAKKGTKKRTRRPARNAGSGGGRAGAGRSGGGRSQRSGSPGDSARRGARRR